MYIQKGCMDPALANAIRQMCTVLEYRDRVFSFQFSYSKCEWQGLPHVVKKNVGKQSRILWI